MGLLWATVVLLLATALLLIASVVPFLLFYDCSHAVLVLGRMMYSCCTAAVLPPWLTTHDRHPLCPPPRLAAALLAFILENKCNAIQIIGRINKLIWDHAVCWYKKTQKIAVEFYSSLSQTNKNLTKKFSFMQLHLLYSVHMLRCTILLHKIWHKLSSCRDSN